MNWGTGDTGVVLAHCYRIREGCDAGAWDWHDTWNWWLIGTWLNVLSATMPQKANCMCVDLWQTASNSYTGWNVKVKRVTFYYQYKQLSVWQRHQNHVFRSFHMLHKSSADKSVTSFYSQLYLLQGQVAIFIFMVTEPNVLYVINDWFSHDKPSLQFKR